MAKFADVKKEEKPFKTGIDHIYFKNVTFKEMQEGMPKPKDNMTVEEQEEFNKKASEVHARNIFSKVVCNEAGETYDEFQTDEGINENLSMRDTKFIIEEYASYTNGAAKN